MKVPGVEKVKDDSAEHRAPAKYAPLDGVAVIAKNTWAAIKGCEALKIKWDDGSNKSYDSSPTRQCSKEMYASPEKWSVTGRRRRKR